MQKNQGKVGRKPNEGMLIVNVDAAFNIDSGTYAVTRDDRGTCLDYNFTTKKPTSASSLRVLFTIGFHCRIRKLVLSIICMVPVETFFLKTEVHNN